MNLRELPSVDQVFRELESLEGFPREVVVCEIRDALAEIRETGVRPGPVAQLVKERLQALREPSLRRVINATGVVLHTNLGRAPLPAFTPIEGYSNLEYDLISGKRGAVMRIRRACSNGSWAGRRLSSTTMPRPSIWF